MSRPLTFRQADGEAGRTVGVISKVPTSQSPPWSWGAADRALIGGGAAEVATALTAGLPGTSAWICIGPPLLARAVSRMAQRALGTVADCGRGEVARAGSEAINARFTERPTWPKRLKLLAMVLANIVSDCGTATARMTSPNGYQVDTGPMARPQ